ncbi:MAG: CoA transferase [Candidatus Binatia bacterium]
MADMQSHAGMLSGCRVLDFTQYLAGPTVTRLMAKMGADIVKVEIAPMGDPARLLPTIKAGRSGYFVQQNRGKKSLCLDWRQPEAIEILRALLGTILSLRPFLGSCI